MKQGKLLSVLAQKMDEEHVQLTVIDGLEVGDMYIVHGFADAMKILSNIFKALWEPGEPAPVGPLSPDELKQLTDEKEN